MLKKKRTKKRTNRIIGNTRTGKGDSGFTELIKGYRYPKSDQLCFIYNHYHTTALDLQIYLNKYNYLIDDIDIKIINEFIDTILFNTNAASWTRFEEIQEYTDDLIKTNRELIEERNNELNKYFPNAKEFIRFKSTEVCVLGKIQLELRNVEHFVWQCIHRFYSYDHNSIPNNIKAVGSFYNLVGDYFYNLCRYIQKYKLNREEEYWKNE